MVPAPGAGDEPRAEIVARGRALMDDMGIADLAKSDVTQVSGGQLQRFALARALAGGAKVMILDEVTANLDSVARDEICELLRTLKPRVAMLVITHDRAVVESLCDREIPLG